VTVLVAATVEDVAARQLVAHFLARGVDSALLLCADLARPGWQLTLGGPESDLRAVVGNRQIRGDEIRGVVSRLWAVTAAEAPFMHEEDRAYACAEMHAFLLAFLTSLSCPLLNRPAPESLAGPGYSYEQWLLLAGDVGLRTAELRRRSSYSRGATAEPFVPPWALPRSGTVEVTAVGDESFGATSDAQRDAVQRLRRRADVELLRVVLGTERDSELELVFADYWANVADPHIADAIARRCGT